MRFLHLDRWQRFHTAPAPLTKLLLQAVDCCQVARVDLPLPAGTVAAQAAAAIAALA
jgi:hypothetical protein